MSTQESEMTLIAIRIQVVRIDIRALLEMYAILQEFLAAALEGAATDGERESWGEYKDMYDGGRAALTAFQEVPDELVDEEGLDLVGQVITDHQEVAESIVGTLNAIGVDVPVGA